jgi:ribosomal protein S18 acetylase RimI-like enzyme
METEIRILRRGDEAVLDHVAPEVFDDPVDRVRTTVFLGDPRHHLAVAIDGGVVVGFASAVHYVHPDKVAPELWINEVGVTSTHRGRGLARRILRALFEVGRACGCRQAWVGTTRSNPAAMRLYAALDGKEDAGDLVMFTFTLSEEGRVE